MSLDTGAARQDAPRREHRPYRYLINEGGQPAWVHCPVCRSVNDGWWPDGNPKYTGGFLHVLEPYDNKPGSQHAVTYACLCGQGKRRAAALGSQGQRGGRPGAALAQERNGKQSDL